MAPTHSKELEEPPPLPAGLQAVGGEQRAVLLQEGRAERGSGRRDTPQLSTSALQPGGGQGGAGRGRELPHSTFKKRGRRCLCVDRSRG